MNKEFKALLVLTLIAGQLLQIDFKNLCSSDKERIKEMTRIPAQQTGH